MKGLIKTLIILLALIVVGVGVSAIITIDLQGKVAAAREEGFEQGRTEGYGEGWQEGHKAGYQSGSRVGYEKGNGGQTADGEDGFYFIYNPTYDEMQAMLAAVKADSAEEIHHYAESNGIRVAYVRCLLARRQPRGWSMFCTWSLLRR